MLKMDVLGKLHHNRYILSAKPLSFSPSMHHFCYVLCEFQYIQKYINRPANNKKGQVADFRKKTPPLTYKMDLTVKTIMTVEISKL